MNTFSEIWDADTLNANRHPLYLARLARLRAMMKRADMPALLIIDSVNIFYATGARNMTIFSTRTPARYLLILEDGPAVLYEYFGSEHLAKDLPTIDDIRPAEGLCRVSSGGYVKEASARFAAEIASAIRGHDPSIDKIGVDRFPFSATDALRREGFFLVESDLAVVPARSIKLPIELPYLREAMQRIDIGVANLENNVVPGQTESEAWAEFHYELMAKEGQYTVSRLFQSGPNTFPYFQECGSRTIEDGDLLCLDTDAIGYEGYSVDYSRTFLAGDRPASDGQRLLYGRAREQLETNAGLLKPGVEFREIAEKAWPVPAEHRKSRYYCIGHGIGLAGEFPNIPHHVPGRDYPLKGVVEPGMVICIESYVGSEDQEQGVKLEDQFLIHDDRVERMSHYPFDRRLGGGA